MTRKVIIDTDPGVDDAMAIFFALCSPELDVIGLTTVFGNVHTDLATTNALRLLEIAGRSDIPVAQGADAPLVRPYGGPVPYVHGEDGQGNVPLPPPSSKAIETQAAVFIVEQIMRAPGEITLVPLGPLTNIALALRLEPRIAHNVREVVLMGGNALCPGNATPAAEANIHNDPEAADLVFGAPWQVTMVGLDVTHRVNMTRAHLERYAQVDKPMAQHIARITPFYRDFFEKTYHCDGIYVHDSSAVAYVIDPSLFKVERWPVRVDTSSGVSRGKTWPGLGDPLPPPWQGRPLVNVCVEVDGERLIEMEYERVCQSSP
ncbi:MAG: nucleoside hydrolase [Chloroflexota bacterium]|nr:MAG: nucleoside hydrolase [Chloroflexota bacterium]